MNKGIFVISLDFELHWGVSDHFSVHEYFKNLSETRRAIDETLILFDQKKIHCTWATVGMLFCKTRKELFDQVSEGNRPRYRNPNLSNYLHAEKAGDNEQDDPFHFALSTINKINKYPNQEIATHTFSHYYCLEPPHDLTSFEEDLKAAGAVAANNNFLLTSIVFPRNQVTPAHLNICSQHSIKCYRGTQQTWFHRPVTQKSEKQMVKRFFRVMDHYINITGSNGYDLKKIPQPFPVKNIPQSRFLRPYSNKMAFAEFLRMKRIKNEMTKAAQKGRMYHLWWHPHNFGNDVEKNILVLQQLLDHFSFLESKYGMVSMNMAEVYVQYFKSDNDIK